MKYLKKGGFTFEEMYGPLVQFCIDYNNREDLFGENSFIHIKGGASIKHHLNNRFINTIGITSDIDILLIPNEEEDSFKKFYLAFQEKFSSSTPNITYKEVNGLYNICIDEICIFDITIYHHGMDEDEDEETSMFLYAVRSLGFGTIDSYVDELLRQSNIEIRTFTTIPFEYYSTKKGIENNEKYLSLIEKWRSNKLQYESINPRTPNINRIIARLNYQTTPGYIAKLQDKYLRYTQKFQILHNILYPS